jgi:hypothetical protein
VRMKLRQRTKHGSKHWIVPSYLLFELVHTEDNDGTAEYGGGYKSWKEIDKRGDNSEPIEKALRSVCHGNMSIRIHVCRLLKMSDWPEL